MFSVMRLKKLPEHAALSLNDLNEYLKFAVIQATFGILTRTRCQLQGNAVGETIQHRNDLSGSALFRVKHDLVKSREKRVIDGPVVSNKTVQDHHKYYTLELYHDGQHLWSDLRGKAGSVHDEYLSSTKLAVKNVKLSFEFPYYGHMVTNATLTTGGFINLGTSKNRQIANFQFVAPLMAYFNPSLTRTSTVHYFDSGNEFIVQWSNVFLHDNPQAGSFTFQCMLNKTGEIVFSYHKIPIPVVNISSVEHTVNIGISDAYYVDKLKHYYGIWQIFRTFYAYDAVHINKNWVVNNTAVILRPKKNCISARTCGDCTERRQSTEFHCTWCNKLKRCSDGFDRYHSEWLTSGCNMSGVFQLEKCVIQSKQQEEEPTLGLAPWLIAVICVCAVVVFGLVAWLVYAFTHPTSRSGLCLIQHGPGSCYRKAPEKYQERGPTNSSVFNKVLF
ncbi:Plexin domain-containing protein 1 [Desmophyllum pertusum]|uniref:Plexin domain-containing protein 1 n=1 Tax=Desmophyllum pertusum TaxID=174260 RepID=A0A9X0CQD5_9CNID|nr:Plexin domain-containing protein 1 [Desmophyllum pertusum]